MLYNFPTLILRRFSCCCLAPSCISGRINHLINIFLPCQAQHFLHFLLFPVAKKLPSDRPLGIPPRNDKKLCCYVLMRSLLSRLVSTHKATLNCCRAKGAASRLDDYSRLLVFFPETSKIEFCIFRAKSNYCHLSVGRKEDEVASADLAGDANWGNVFSGGDSAQRPNCQQFLVLIKARVVVQVVEWSVSNAHGTRMNSSQWLDQIMSLSRRWSVISNLTAHDKRNSQ